MDYSSDRIRAVDAKFEAQKIAFAPLAFQAARAFLETGVLQAISDAGERGLSRQEIAEKTGISEYGAGVLAEMALGMRALRLVSNDTPLKDNGEKEREERFVLGKIGWFLLEDEMTRVNFNFVNDICYEGAFSLLDSVRTGKPTGLSVFGGEWNTIYEALSSLPEQAKKSWFEFDHFYSDIAFPEALPIVFGGEKKPRRLLDIGGNTAKWALACCRYDADVRVTIADLPGQTTVAAKNAADALLSDRIDVFPCNVLSEDTELPAAEWDAVWMSQFLDCFPLPQITRIMEKIARVCGNASVFVLEPLWDMQRFEASAYSLQATSLYFTCMANGGSKMYRFGELKDAIARGGFVLDEAHHNLGSNSYSLLKFRKR